MRVHYFHWNSSFYVQSIFCYDCILTTFICGNFLPFLLSCINFWISKVYNRNRKKSLCLKRQIKKTCEGPFFLRLTLQTFWYKEHGMYIKTYYQLYKIYYIFIYVCVCVLMWMLLASKKDRSGRNAKECEDEIMSYKTKALKQ